MIYKDSGDKTIYKHAPGCGSREQPEGAGTPICISPGRELCFVF